MGRDSIFYLVSAAVWVFSVFYDVSYQPRFGHDWYIYKLVMLTNLNFILITIYSLVAALANYRKSEGFLKDAADFIFYTSAFPVSVTTCALFWGLYAVDPSLVMPPWVARLIPTWLNHVTHTLPIVYLLLDATLTYREPVEARTGIVITLLLVAFYFTVILFVRAVEGYWLYPLLELLEVEHFLLGFVGSCIGYFLLIQLGGVVVNVLSKRSRLAKKQH